MLEQFAPEDARSVKTRKGGGRASPDPPRRPGASEEVSLLPSDAGLPPRRVLPDTEDDPFLAFTAEAQLPPSFGRQEVPDALAHFDLGTETGAAASQLVVVRGVPRAGNARLYRSLLFVGASMLLVLWVERLTDRSRQPAGVPATAGSAFADARPLAPPPAAQLEAVGSAPETVTSKPTPAAGAAVDLALLPGAGAAASPASRAAERLATPGTAAADPPGAADRAVVAARTKPAELAVSIRHPDAVPLLPAAPPELAVQPLEPIAAPETRRAAVLAPATDARLMAAEAVRQTLRRYAHAYEDLDVEATARVWPSVDRRALARAFATIRSQGLTFDSCEIDVIDGQATAHCRGIIRFVPKVGSPTPSSTPQEWQFRMRKAATDWQIEHVMATHVSTP